MDDQEPQPPERTRDVLERLAREKVERPGTDWHAGTAVPGTDGQWYASDGAVPVPEQVPERVPAPGRTLVHLGDSVQVVRVLAQSDVPEIRHALMAYGPPGRYWYDVGLSTTDPWADAEAFHVIKLWYTDEPDQPRGSWVKMYAASGRVTGFPEPATIAATVQGILNTLERLKARGTYGTRTPDSRPAEPLEPRPEDLITRRPIRDNPQA
jgi:hypothetical protein